MPKRIIRQKTIDPQTGAKVKTKTNVRSGLMKIVTKSPGKKRNVAYVQGMSKVYRDNPEWAKEDLEPAYKKGGSTKALPKAQYGTIAKMAKGAKTVVKGAGTGLKAIGKTIGKEIKPQPYNPFKKPTPVKDVAKGAGIMGAYGTGAYLYLDKYGKNKADTKVNYNSKGTKTVVNKDINGKKSVKVKTTGGKTYYKSN